MKAILVLDEMPEDCCQCPCFIERVRFDGMKWHSSCYKLQKEVGEYGTPRNCPLKPMPERFTDYVQCEDENDEYEVYKEISENGERRGWNMCIDEILGDNR